MIVNMKYELYFKQQLWVFIYIFIFLFSCQAIAITPETAQPEETNIKKIINDLMSDDYNTRQNAGEKLIGLGQPSVPYLIKLYRSSEGNLRLDIITLLSKLPCHDTESFLISLLKDSEKIIRYHAIFSLGEIGKPEFYPILYKLLDDSSLTIKDFALEALFKLGIQEKEKELHQKYVNLTNATSKNDYPRSFEYFSRISIPADATMLINDLLSQDGIYKEHTYNSLKKIGKPVIPKLIKILDDREKKNDRKDYSDIYRLLGDLNSYEAIPFLMKALRSRFSTDIKAAKYALTKINHESLSNFLEKGLDNKDKMIRQFISNLATEKKIKFNTPKTRTYQLLYNNENLGSVTFQDISIEILLHEYAVNNGSETIQNRILDIIKHFQQQTAPILLVKLRNSLDINLSLADALSAVSEELMYSPLAAITGKPGCDFPKLNATIALGKTKNPQLKELFTINLNETDERCRKEAAYALALLGTPDVLNPLENCAVSKDDASCARAIGDISNAQSTKILVRLLASNKSEIRELAIKTLEKRNWKPSNEKEIVLSLYANKNFQKLSEHQCASDILTQLLSNPKAWEADTITRLQYAELESVKTIAEKVFDETTDEELILASLTVLIIKDHNKTREIFRNHYNKIDSLSYEKKVKFLSLFNHWPLEESKEILIKYTIDPESDVRSKAAFILRDKSWEPSDFHERQIYFITHRDWDKVVADDPAILNNLIILLNSKDKSIIDGAVSVLLRYDADTVKYLIDQYNKVEGTKLKRNLFVLIPQFNSKDSKDFLINNFAMIEDVDLKIEALKNCKGNINYHQSEFFIKLLDDRYPDIRSQAARILLTTGVPIKDKTIKAKIYIYTDEWYRLPELSTSAIPPLIEILKLSETRSKGYISSEEIRIANKYYMKADAAANALIDLGEPAKKELITLFLNSDGTSGQYALYALEKMNWKPENRESLLHCYYIRSDLNSLMKEGSDGLQYYVKIINKMNSDEEQKHAALLIKESPNFDKFKTDFILSDNLSYSYKELFIDELQNHLNDNNLQMLFELYFKSSNNSLHNKISEILEGLGERSEKILLEYLKNGTLDEMQGAIPILAKQKSEKAYPILVALLDNHKSRVHMSVVRFIGYYQNEETIQLLKKYNEMYPTYVGAGALMNSLWEYDENGKKAVINYLIHPDSTIRNAAASKLRSLQWKPENTTEDLYYSIGNGYWEEVAQYGAKAENILISFCGNNDNHYLNIKILKTLITIGTPQAKKAVFENILKSGWDSEEYVELLALVAGEHRDKLRTILNDKKSNNRRIAIKTLGNLKDVESVPFLIEILKSSNIYESELAAISLIKIGNESTIKIAFEEIMANDYLIKPKVLAELLNRGNKDAINLFKQNVEKFLKYDFYETADVIIKNDIEINPSIASAIMRRGHRLLKFKFFIYLIQHSIPIEPEVLEYEAKRTLDNDAEIIDNYIESIFKSKNIEYLKKYVLSCSSHISSTSVLKLEKLGYEPVTLQEDVVFAVRKNDRKVLQEIIDNNPNGVIYLLEMIEKTSDNSPQSLLDILKSLVNSDNITFLAGYLGNDTLWLRAECAVILKHHNWQPRTAKEDILFSIALLDKNRLNKHNQVSIPFLLEILINQQDCHLEHYKEKSIAIKQFSSDCIIDLGREAIVPIFTTVIQKFDQFQYSYSYEWIVKTINKLAEKHFEDIFIYLNNSNNKNIKIVYKLIRKADIYIPDNMIIRLIEKHYEDLNYEIVYYLMSSQERSFKIAEQILHHKNPKMRLLAIDLLYKVNSDDAKGLIVSMIEDDTYEVVKRAAFSNNRYFSDYKTNGKLTKYLTGINPFRQYYAMHFIEQTGERYYIPFIQKLMFSENYLIRDKATNSLLTLLWSPTSTKEKVYVYYTLEEYSKIQEYGKSAVPHLLNFVKLGSTNEHLYKLLRANGWKPQNSYEELLEHLAMREQAEIIKMSSRAIKPLMELCIKYRVFDRLQKHNYNEEDNFIHYQTKYNFIYSAFYINIEEVLKNLLETDFGGDQETLVKWWEKNKERYISKSPQ